MSSSSIVPLVDRGLHLPYLSFMHSHRMIFPKMPALFAAFAAIAFLMITGCERTATPSGAPADVFERAEARVEDGALVDALELFTQAEVQFRAIGRRDVELRSIVRQAEIALELHRYRLALGKAAAGADMARHVGEFRPEAAMRMVQGRVYEALGSAAAARPMYAEAQRICETFNDLGGLAAALVALGRLELDSEDPAGAADIFQRALTSAQTAGRAELQADALSGIGEVFRRQGKMDEATNSMLQATRFIDRTERPLQAAHIQMRLGDLQQEAHNSNASLNAYREGVNALRRARTNRSFEAQLLFSIARLYAANGRTEDERKYMASALDVARREGDRIAHAYLGFISFKQSVDLIPPDQRAGQAPRLAQLSLQYADRFRAILQRPGEAAALYLAGRLMAGAGARDRAIAMYAAAATAERERYLSWLDADLYRPFAEAVNVDSRQPRFAEALAAEYLRLNRTDDAIVVLEQFRQSEAADLIDGVDLDLRHPTLRTEATALRNDLLQLRLAAVEWSARQSDDKSASQQQDLRGSFSATLRNLRSRAARIAAQFPNYGPVVRSDTVLLGLILRSVPRGIATIQYVDAGDGVAAIVVRRDHRASVPLNGSSLRLRRSVQEYMTLLQDPLVYSGEGGEASVPQMTRFATLSTDLYDALIRPLEGDLEKGAVIVHSPLLGGLPVHALEKQDRSGRVESLIEYMSVDYVPSLMSLTYPTRSSARIRDVVAVGNPSGRNWSVDYELRDIRSFYRSAQVLVGRDASLSNLRSTKADVLQLATDFSPGVGSFGTFTVATGESSEGSESVPFEVLGNTEPTPVMILTNQSGNRHGLDVRHAWLLRMNGTSDVFLNGWTADRKAAKFFSEYFFTHLSNGLAPGDAYRQALLNLIQTTGLSHPRSWAQFFHYGIG